VISCKCISICTLSVIFNYYKNNIMYHCTVFYTVHYCVSLQILWYSFLFCTLCKLLQINAINTGIRQQKTTCSPRWRRSWQSKPAVARFCWTSARHSMHTEPQQQHNALITPVRTRYSVQQLKVPINITYNKYCRNCAQIQDLNAQMEVYVCDAWRVLLPWMPDLLSTSQSSKNSCQMSTPFKQ